MSRKLVLVCGSRGWQDELVVHEELRKLSLEGFGSLIHGGARGADSIADQEARLLGYAVKEFPANWELYGRSAGMLRNEQMANQGPDLVLAFWLGPTSRGTEHMVRLARGLGIPVRVVARGKPEFTLTFFEKKVSKETLHGGVACLRS